MTCASFASCRKGLQAIRALRDMGPTVVWELRTPGGYMLAWLQSRPSYCDRGRWVQGIDAPGVWRSDADPGPRYYFDLDAGKAETIAYLTAKGVTVGDASWELMK